MKNYCYAYFKGSAFVRFIFVFSIFFLFKSTAFPGTFGVSPVKLVFDREVKTGAVNVVNNGDDPLQVQMRAFEWTQDAEGKDQYKETEEVIFFPKIMKVDKGETKILRAGIKIPAVAKEKTYRLFIEEIPGPKKEQSETQIQIKVRFGVPIFVKPLKEELSGEVEKVLLTKGQLDVAVRNTGNLHFVVNSINIKGVDLKGEEIFSKELSGWYLLHGTSRSYTTPIPEEACQKISKIEVGVKTDQLSLNGKLDVDKTMCMP